MDVMKAIIATADVVASLFLAIILMSHYLDRSGIAGQTRTFRNCVWICLLGLAGDALSYILDGMAGIGPVIWLANYASYVMLDIFGPYLSLYIYERITEAKPGYTKHYIVLIDLLCTIDIVFCTVGALTGRLFTVHGGVYAAGPWADYASLLPTICLLVDLVMIVRQRKVLGVKQALVLSSYLLMPAIAVILLLIDESWEFGYVCSAIGMAIIYILLQSKIVSEANIRAEVYSILSSKDVMTGLANRRAYDKMLKATKDDATEGGDERIGAVFCDLNSLKETNDKYGHEAGDQLIRGFAKLLVRSFPDDEVFRISGDEFVIVVRDVTEEEFEARMATFADTLRDNDNVAAFGYDMGDRRDTLDVIKSAERGMYADKSLYYQETGKDRRHRD